MVGYTCNSSTWGSEAGGFPSLSSKPTHSEILSQDPKQTEPKWLLETDSSRAHFFWTVRCSSGLWHPASCSSSTSLFCTATSRWVFLPASLGLRGPGRRQIGQDACWPFKIDTHHNARRVWKPSGFPLKPEGDPGSHITWKRTPANSALCSPGHRALHLLSPLPGGFCFHIFKSSVIYHFLRWRLHPSPQVLVHIHTER